MIFSFKGYTLITDNGTCVHKNGNWVPKCVKEDVDSVNDCKETCTSLEDCVGYFYNLDENRNCRLIVTTNLSNHCPHGYEWKQGNSGRIKSAGDLKANNLPGWICFAKNHV